MTRHSLRASTRCLLGAASAATLALAGCNPGTFVDLEDQAPVVAIGRPSAFGRTGFGATVASVEGRLLNGEPSTRLAVGGGPDTGTWLYDIWNVDDIGNFRISSTACETPADDCTTGTGSAIVGVPRFATDPPLPALPSRTCIAMGESAVNQVRFKCETQPGTAFLSSAGMGAALELGAALAAVPDAFVESTRSIVLAGAPGANAQTGSVFRVPLGGGAPFELGEIAATPGVVSADGRLGAAIAAAALPTATTLATNFPTVPTLGLDTPFLAAVGAPGQNRVVVVAVGVDPLDSSDIDALVLACFDGPDGFGQVLATGDVDGDGMPEVYMGIGEGTVGHPGVVRVFDLADLSTLGQGCADTTNADDIGVTTLSCPTLDGVDCTGSAFGSALALGDVDADGRPDLVVGAPGMTVDNKLGAGGVFALAGSSSGVNMSRSAFMSISHPGTDDRLGASVTTLRTHYQLPGVTERFEVAAGAPGANSAFVFLCSGLGDDSSTTGDRCLELGTE